MTMHAKTAKAVQRLGGFLRNVDRANIFNCATTRYQVPTELTLASRLQLDFDGDFNLEPKLKGNFP